MQAIIERGYTVLSPASFAALASSDVETLDGLRAAWNDLPADAYLRDGGRYRKRRHASYLVRVDGVEPVAQRAHWQPIEYNALHGGLERWFAPIEASVAAQPAWTAMLRGLAQVATVLRRSGAAPWYCEAHQFRIDTTDGI
ncbi:MAG: 2OG-Fe dioxygenase family protein, partial [Pseudomonadota bacterium]|nr:2OG-Fe dioxygenase family protein [Pseudomonadota bacterium]